jgi:hypothetical protein
MPLQVADEIHPKQPTNTNCQHNQSLEELSPPHFEDLLCVLNHKAATKSTIYLKNILRPIKTCFLMLFWLFRARFRKKIFLPLGSAKALFLVASKIISTINRHKKLF